MKTNTHSFRRVMNAPLAVRPRSQTLLVSPLGCPACAGVADVGGFFDAITGAISSAATALTGGTPGPGDFYDVNIHGRKIPASDIFTKSFTAIRTPSSVQGVANQISSGSVQVREDGSVGNASITIAPIASVNVAAYRSIAPSAAVAAPKPAIEMGATPGLFSSLPSLPNLSASIFTPTIPSTVVSGAYSALFSGAKVSSAVPYTGPAYFTPTFRAAATTERLTRIDGYLKSGAAVVFPDGSVMVPGTTEMFAPPGSVDLTAWRAAGGTVRVATATLGTPPTTPGGLLSSVKGAIGSLFGSTIQTATDTAKQGIEAQVTERITGATFQQSALNQQANAASQALASQQAAFNAEQTRLRQQLAQQQSELERQRVQSQMAAQQAEFDRQKAVAEAQIAEIRRQSEAVRVAASVPVSGPVTMPGSIASGLSTSSPVPTLDFSGAGSGSGIIPALAGIPASPPPQKSDTIKFALGLGLAAALVGGVVYFTRRRRR